MKQRIKDFRQWVKEHKGILAVAGISAVALIALVLCARNKEEIDCVLSALKKAIKDVSPKDLAGKSLEIDLSDATQPILGVYDSESHTIVQQVPLFVRKLPENWHHSAEKAEEAKRLGIELALNETLVDPHQRVRTIA